MSLLQTSGVAICAPGGRLLFDGLNLVLDREHVALVGRNGVGKSTLLAVLAGDVDPTRGVVRSRSKPHFVPQSLEPARMSHGEQRRRALAAARTSKADILLLDEPTEDLDDAAVEWLRGWLRRWDGCVIVSSHDRRLLTDFRHFFIASEAGCRCFSGSLADLDVAMERDHREAQERYASNLQRLSTNEERAVHLARRKARKKRYGRCSELDRATSRMRLNQKRSDAQVSHGRAAAVREGRLAELREWSKATRRALGVTLSLQLPVTSLSPSTTLPRVAVVGPNGSGKTTLLETILEQSTDRTGAIAQGGTNWMRDDTLASLLVGEDVSALLVQHRFPFALASRPLRSLSPGERTRAALICLYQRPLDLLVLDEPTCGLDLVGQRAMTEALRAWSAGLVVASHDRAFLAAIGVTSMIELPGAISG